MDDATVLGHISGLVDSIGVAGDGLADGLMALAHDLAGSVDSYCGLVVTLQLSGWPITFRSVRADGPAQSSLRLPLPLLRAKVEAGSVAVFYARTPGAFVDLAADLSYSLGVPLETGSARSEGVRDGVGQAIVLDADLPPRSTVSGWSGLEEYSTINRAIGILIDKGHSPTRAARVLRAGAAAAGVTMPDYAARLLAR